ncbi:unnamed protein product [Candida verbasci]|uniref:Zinc-regulated transporter 1 n=1 Tax=Candida verbasci TaxID=1227364 RepID=A0A9W4TXL3_9ASCO|nr:unnamed protein product [Candida verbasci]
MTNLHIREDTCLQGNHYNGEHFIARITSIPVLFIVSALGSFFPLVALHCKFIRLPSWLFFVTRYFGSGVIIATGFIHLMAESSQSLNNECLGGVFNRYPMTEGICLMSVFFIFFFDIIAHKKVHERAKLKDKSIQEETIEVDSKDEVLSDKVSQDSTLESQPKPINHRNSENIYQQILNCVVLECGIVLHSVFVGLSLTIAGDEFVTLYIAIGFHQFFEGLGLGSRFATTYWPKGKGHVPWLMCLAYSLTTPTAAGIGLGVRNSYPVGSRTSLITTGVFDALCAGVLIYNSIAELMAYDFMYSNEFADKSMKTLLSGFFFLSFGAFAMALIGRWA